MCETAFPLECRYFTNPNDPSSYWTNILLGIVIREVLSFARKLD